MILFDRYLDKAKCIIEQYSNYTIKEIENLPLNGINTQGENIADNGGIKEAYKAYSKYLIHSYIILTLTLFQNIGQPIIPQNLYCLASLIPKISYFG